MLNEQAQADEIKQQIHAAEEYVHHAITEAECRIGHVKNKASKELEDANEGIGNQLDDCKCQMRVEQILQSICVFSTFLRGRWNFLDWTHPNQSNKYSLRMPKRKRMLLSEAWHTDYQRG